jgi:hypothetical protein
MLPYLHRGSSTIHQRYLNFWALQPPGVRGKEIKSMSTPTLQPKLVDIQTDLVALIEADEREIELLTKRAQKNRDLLHAINGSINAFTAQVTGSGNLTDTVRAIIKSLPADRFTAPDVEHALTAQFPTVPLDKGGLRTALWNLTKRGEINCTRKGTNRLPAEYLRPPMMGVADGDSATTRVRRRATLDLLTSPNGEGH